MVAHYNALPQRTAQARRTSRIAGLRQWHNYVKAVLLQWYTPRGAHVLDLCCGKGGDLHKWGQCGVGHLVMVDIAEVSIQQARERHAASRGPRSVEFHVADCFSPELCTGPGPLTAHVQCCDVVSCQFSMHYAFSDADTAHALFATVAACLKPGGMFIATVPDGEVVARRFFNSRATLSNALHSVTLKRTSAARALMTEPCFGQGVTFNLLEAVESVKEYLVTRCTVEYLAAAHGLHLVQWVPLSTFALSACGADKGMSRLMDNMVYINRTQEEAHISDLYAVVVLADARC